MAGYARKFSSIEQALKETIKDLGGENIKTSTDKSESHFRKCSDENDLEHHIYHKDSVNLDITSMRAGKGHPLLTAHETLLNNALKSKNEVENITSTLINMGGRLGNLMDVTNKALDPNGHGGSDITPQEKDRIYKAIKEVEGKIVNLKLSIGLD